MRLSTAYDDVAKQFVAVAERDGVEQHVRFDSAAAFRAWVHALEARLESEQNAAAAGAGAGASKIRTARHSS
jgi:hypothetical protein